MPNPFLLCNTTTTVPSPSAPAHYCVSLCVCVYFRNGTINMFSIYLLFTFRIPDVPLCWCVCFLLRMPTQPRHQIPEPAQPEHRRRTTSSCGTTTSVQVFIYDSRAWSAIFSTGVDSTSVDTNRKLMLWVGMFWNLESCVWLQTCSWNYELQSMY